MDVQTFLNRLQADRHYQGQIVHTAVLPERPARWSDPQTELNPALRAAFTAVGIDRFYTHQAAAIDHASAPDPQHIVVVTGTASGKSLCYNAPVLNRLLSDPAARALYLFPTKALAQDQLGALDRLRNAHPARADNVRASTYDGDTPQHRRRTARAQANIILSNPDMLHANILPQNARWARDGFLTNLRYVVIDEIHAYRGTFGSHVACVLRRLRRLCRHYGCDPTFITCSATIANPRELAARLIGTSESGVHLIDDDGSPAGKKWFVLWNPPFVDSSNLERRSANAEAQYLMRRLIEDSAAAICFAKARAVAELIYKYLHDDLARKHPDLAEKVRPYRGGYLAHQRRDIERALFTGQLLGVCSTNALELGIDVGSLDAAVIVGFPGTFCSIYQQAGRAGRAKEESLALFVAYNDPIDQYFLRHPDYFLTQSAEHAAIDPANPRILESQLTCAAAEFPLTSGDDAWFSRDVLESARRYASRPGTGTSWHISDSDVANFHNPDGRLPHHAVSLRLIGNATFDITYTTTGEPCSIGNVDSISAPELVYPNAVYLHEGDPYIVRHLDLDAKIATVQRADVDYYTQAVLSDHCRIIDTDESAPHRGGTRNTGPIDVTWQTVAFKKIKYYTLEVIGQDALDLPPQTIHTVGLWATLPPNLFAALTAAGHKPIEAMVGIRNLLLATLPMLAMCDRRDISGSVDATNLGTLAMFVYDR